jgi:hypothetical protein
MHDYGFFARDASNMDYWPGDEIMVSLLPVVLHIYNILSIDMVVFAYVLCKKSREKWIELRE